MDALGVVTGDISRREAIVGSLSGGCTGGPTMPHRGGAIVGVTRSMCSGDLWVRLGNHRERKYWR